jgi:L-threonylcarbamoyladenylate synthase
MTLEADIVRAVTILRAGGVVAFPTETVYGLGADAQNAAACAKVFAIKGRPADHPLIVHIASGAELSRWAAHVPALAHELARAFWPGPLTLVLPRGPHISLAATGGLETVGLRVPSHPVALALLRAFDGPLAAPSANRFGAVSPTTAEHVRQDLGASLDFVLDGGASEVGVESTIVDLSSAAPAILRPGGVPPEAIEAIVGEKLPVLAKSSVRTPGQLPSHYAPGAAIRLASARELAAVVASEQAAGQRVGVLRGDATAGWSAPGGVEDVYLQGGDAALARGLYAAMRTLDQRGCDVIVAVLPRELEQGLGLAVTDRLRRAAAPR